jgi:hypothetical protein
VSPSAAVDTALAAWRQGDCVVGEQWFVHRLEKALPLTHQSRVAAEADADLVETAVPGFAILTQTCDIVRGCAERPYVEVCALMKVPADILRDVERARRPGFAFLPCLADGFLVADLDRVMTVEKAVVANWSRTPGWESNTEARHFAQALSRKHMRFAFPDDFNCLIKALQNRLTGKHDKDTDEGRALRSLREIRVQASPAWDAPQVELFFWFVRDESPVNFEGRSWASLLSFWLAQPAGRFHSVEAQVVTLQDMSAREYVDSDRLDLDRLTAARSLHR